MSPLVPTPKHVLQFQATLEKNGTGFTAAREIILGWAQERAEVELPAEKVDQQSFALNGSFDGSALSVESDQDLWTMRLVGKDAAHTLWTTEATLVKAHGRTHIGVNVSVESKTGQAPTPAKLPGFLKQLEMDIGLCDYGHRLGVGFETAEDPKQVGDLLALIREQNRTRPVFVISLDGRTKNPDKALVNPHVLAQEVGVMGHCVLLRGQGRTLLESLLGKRWTPTPMGVRVYMPGFTPERDSESKHPSFSATELTSWEDANRQSFAQKAFATAVSLSVQGPHHDKVPGFNQVLQTIYAAQANDRTSDLKTRLDMTQNLVATLQEQNKAQTAEITDLWALLAEEQTKRGEAEERARLLEVQLKTLQAPPLVESYSTTIEQDWRNCQNMITRLPHAYDAVEDWIKEAQLEDRILLLESAKKGLKFAAQPKNKGRVYKYPEDLGRALLFLACEFRDIRVASSPKLLAWYKERLAREKFTISSPAEPKGLTADKQADYYVMGPEGKKILLEQHLTCGHGMKAQNCMTVNFAYAPHRRQVLIGGPLPLHLATTKG